MSRYYQILLVACLAIALCNAEAPRYRSRNGRLQVSKQRSRLLARQQVADEVGVTPYPSAKELIPDIPFDETAAAAPSEVTAEPEAPFAPVDENVNFDQPAQDEVDVEEVEVEADEVPVSDGADDAHLPDEVYGPPELDDALPAVNEPSVEEEEQDDTAEAQLQSSRLVFGRRLNGRNFAARPAKLQAPSLFSARSASAKSARIVGTKVASKTRPERLRQRQFTAAQRQQQRSF